MADFSEVSIFLDVEMDDGAWRWEKDFQNKNKKLLIVAPDVYDMLSNGIIPDELEEEITKNKNGRSPI